MMLNGKAAPRLEGQEIRRSGVRDPRDRPHPLHGVAHDVRHAGGLLIFLTRQKHLHGQHVVGIESRIDGIQRDESSDQQRRAD